LQALRAGDTLVDLCLSLQSIKKARGKVEEALAGKPFNIPTNQSEATVLKNWYCRRSFGLYSSREVATVFDFVRCFSISSYISEIKLALSAINLPVLEPLTPSKLDKLSTLSMAVLHCAVSQAAASAVLATVAVVSPKCSAQQSQTGLKEDDFETQAVTLVEEALNMYSYIGSTIKNSTRAGGHVYQNHLLAGAWVLVSGLQAHLTSSTTSEKTPHIRERDDKGRSPCKSRDCSSARSGLQKFQQSFGVLSVAIATKALTLLTELFEDLHLEACGGAGSIGQVGLVPSPTRCDWSVFSDRTRPFGHHGAIHGAAEGGTRAERRPFEQFPFLSGHSELREGVHVEAHGSHRN
jgi:E3 ubiquitin-protein ligase UBR4